MTYDYDISPLDLDALRRDHPLLIERFEADAVRESNAQAQHWFAESERLHAALDRAEAVVAAAKVMADCSWRRVDSDDSGPLVAVRQALRAYEDADKEGVQP